ncbi:MAG: LacI family DNA-binding transcriptional regulator [Liquorilactobacillus ghanensis]|uniref:LacI family DNA-binding transcriptional regulator n=1 Tax=Liquorilactobacillus TaxID=2767888 RepID=UPI0039ED6948
MSKISLRDIAETAGVSTATVSYALNNSPQVSTKTRQKIQAIAASMNYYPNRNAQGLRTKHSKIICTLINTFTSLFNGSLVDKIRKELKALGYSLVVIDSSNIDLVDSQLFDGLIVFNYTTSNTQLIALLNHINIPVILMANEIDHPQTDCVVINNAQGMQLLVNLFTQSKHQHPAIITGPSDSYNSNIRLTSCKHAIQHLYPNFDFTKRIVDGNFETHKAQQIAATLLEQGVNFFFCLNDAMAYGVYQAAAARNLKIGIDISVTGFDNNPFYLEHYLPRLTTIDPMIEHWGKRVVSLLISRLENCSHKRLETIYSPVKLITGESIAI